MIWARMLAYITGTVDQELLLRLALPPKSPNLYAYAERWVRSVKEECLGKLILFGEGSWRRGLAPIQNPPSPGTKSPGQKQLAIRSVIDSVADSETGTCALPGANGRFVEILCARGSVNRLLSFFGRAGSHAEISQKHLSN